jgi:hypothetical protein
LELWSELLLLTRLRASSSLLFLPFVIARTELLFLVRRIAKDKNFLNGSFSLSGMQPTNRV